MPSFALLSRVRNYGGDLEIAPTISLLDDEFEMVLFEGESSLGFLKYMLAVVVHQQQNMRGITILRTRQAVFSAPDDRKIHLQVDGEYAGVAPARVEIVPNALTLLVPPGFRARRPASVPASVERRRMDNLTHSLTGLMLSRAGLNRFYPRATLLLIISANIPDIDFVTIVRGPLFYFEQHRGITHSIAAAPSHGAAVGAASVRDRADHARLDNGMGARPDWRRQPSAARLDQHLRHSLVLSLLVGVVSPGFDQSFRPDCLGGSAARLGWGRCWANW